MFGHDWEPAQATIVATHVKSTSGDGTVTIHEYAADVVPASGIAFRALIEEPTIATDFWPPRVGAVVKVHADVRRQKAKFDKSDPQISFKHYQQGRDAQFDALLTQPPAMPVTVSPQAEPEPDATTRLRQLAALKEQGLITDAEYTAKRRVIIDGV
jgi:hypothetical protein